MGASANLGALQALVRIKGFRPATAESFAVRDNTGSRGSQAESIPWGVLGKGGGSGEHQGPPLF